MITDVRINSDLFTKRGHKIVLRKLLREMIERHRDEKLPRHFERNADTAPGGGYGYEKRTAKYQKRKARQVGHQTPLVLTGRLKDFIKSNARITATASRARMTARGYFPMRTAMRGEIERYSRVELSEMKALMQLKYADAARRPEFQDHLRQRKRG